MMVRYLVTICLEFVFHCPLILNYQLYSFFTMISDIVMPEKTKLRVLDRSPLFNHSKPPKMQKRLRYMRGPEKIHNTLQYKQFGIIVSTNHIL